MLVVSVSKKIKLIYYFEKMNENRIIANFDLYVICSITKSHSKGKKAEKSHEISS